MALVKAGRDIRRSPLQFDRPTLTHILVGNDLSSIPAQARHQRVTLEVLATGLAGPANLEVRFNDTVLAPAAGTGPLPYAVSPALVQQGENQVTLSLRGRAPGAPRLEDVRAWGFP